MKGMNAATLEIYLRRSGRRHFSEIPTSCSVTTRLLRVARGSPGAGKRLRQRGKSDALLPPASLPTWLRFRIDVGACAYVKRRISDLAESKGAALEHAHAPTGAAAGKHIPANKLLG